MISLSVQDSHLLVVFKFNFNCSLFLVIKKFRCLKKLRLYNHYNDQLYRICPIYCNNDNAYLSLHMLYLLKICT